MKAVDMEESINEIWRDVEGYEGSYQVSNLGRIKSLDRRDANGYRQKGRFLKLKHNKGYHIVILCKNGVQKTYRVNRLVAIAFIPNPNKYPQVNHKDEIKDNNKMGNLEWCTQKYNNSYGTKIQRQVSNINYKAIAEKTKNKRGKKVYQYTLEKELIKIYPSIREVARDGFDRGALSRCFRKKVNMHKGFIFSLSKLETKEVS